MHFFHVHGFFECKLPLQNVWHKLYTWGPCLMHFIFNLLSKSSIRPSKLGTFGGIRYHDQEAGHNCSLIVHWAVGICTMQQDWTPSLLLILQHYLAFAKTPNRWKLVVRSTYRRLDERFQVLNFCEIAKLPFLNGQNAIPWYFFSQTQSVDLFCFSILMFTSV